MIDVRGISRGISLRACAFASMYDFDRFGMCCSALVRRTVAAAGQSLVGHQLTFQRRTHPKRRSDVLDALIALTGPGCSAQVAEQGRVAARPGGRLLAQQLLAAGEQVLDIQPKLGSRVRLLSWGSSVKNDPND